MQGIADDFCHRTVMGKNDIGHAGEILIEQWSEDAWVQRFHKRGETGDVGEKRRNFAALPAEIDGISVAGQPLRQIRREVTRQRRIGPFGRRLALTRVSQELDMPERLGDRGFQVEKIDRLGHEIERAAVHRGADIGHVAIG